MQPYAYPTIIFFAFSRVYRFNILDFLYIVYNEYKILLARALVI